MTKFQANDSGTIGGQNLPTVADFAAKIHSFGDMELPPETTVKDAKGRPEDLESILRRHRTWIESIADPGARIAGHRAVLSGCDLRGANLSRRDLRGIDLSGANLEGANMQGTQLLLANLSGANLKGADLRGARLRLADLSGANLENADLTGAVVE